MRRFPVPFCSAMFRFPGPLWFALVPLGCVGLGTKSKQKEMAEHAEDEDKWAYVSKGFFYLGGIRFAFTLIFGHRIGIANASRRALPVITTWPGQWCLSIPLRGCLPLRPSRPED